MRFLLSAALGLLIGCSNNPVKQPDASSPVAPEPVPVSPSAGDREETAAPSQPPAPPSLQRPFPEQSLYALLVAEFALRRRDYDLALKNYMEQADVLRDSAISAHTTKLAQFMNRDREALHASRLWVALDPDNLEARLTLANLLARRGESRAALPHMEYILRAGGLANFTALARGFRDMSGADRLQFLGSIESLAEQYPDNVQLRICMVLLLEEMGKHESALAGLQGVFRIDAGQLQAVVLDAKLRLDLRQPERAFERIEAILEANPDNQRLRMQYARLLTRVDMARAEQEFRTLVEQVPEDPDLLFSLALIQRETRDLDGARQNLMKLLELNQRTDEAHYYLGKTAEQQQRWEDALTHYMQVQPHRDFGAATDRIAQLLLAAGQAAELGAYFDHLRQRFPQLSERLYTLEADKLSSFHHRTEALQLLDRGIAEFPHSTSLRYSRSMLYEQEGSLAVAERDLRHILEREPDNAAALNALGYMLANRSDRYLEAERLISRALQIEPEEAAILDSMGWVKYRLGEYETALDYLQQAYRAFPDPEVAAHLGEVLWVLGDREAARRIWHDALQNAAEHPILTETMQHFEAIQQAP